MPPASTSPWPNPPRKIQPSRDPLPCHAGVLPALLVSCAEYRPRSQPREEFSRSEKWRHAPAWARAALQQDWWKAFHDSHLNSRIESALSRNPDLRVLGTRLERARAQTGQANAAFWPTITLGTGLLTGREQDRSTAFSPKDLQPWASSAAVSWEMDLFGRLGAMAKSAREAEQAAFWELQAGRLLVATEVAGAHFRILRLNEERSLVADSTAANQMIVLVLREREQAGLISKTELRRQEAEQERLSRGLLDLDRLRNMAHIQLETLCGGQQLAHTAHALSSVQTPSLPGRKTSIVMSRRPDLLAAEARVRSAFQLEESTRLQLLPSLSLTPARTEQVAPRSRASGNGQLPPVPVSTFRSTIRTGSRPSRSAAQQPTKPLPSIAGLPCRLSISRELLPESHQPPPSAKDRGAGGGRS